MKRSLAFLALTCLMIGASGCGCCRNGLARRQTCPTPQPVVSQCAPVCGPSCAPACDACGTSGQFTYNYGATPGVMTLPQTIDGLQGMEGVQMMEGVPMMAPSSGCSTCAQ